MKTCTRCSVEQDLSNFYKKRVRADGTIAYHSYCKSCHYSQVKEKLLTSEESKTKRQESLRVHGSRPTKILQNRRAAWKHQGMDPDEAEQVWRQCNGICGICGGSGNGKSLHVDHDHVTGKVRAMLCQSCNTLLGASKESRRILIAAIDYIDRFDN